MDFKEILEDFYNTPEGMMVELIEGEFVYNESPTFSHQYVLGELEYECRSFVKRNHGKCVILGALNLQLWEDRPTVFIPDLAIVCDRKKISDKGVLGPADLVVEILSPSTKGRDIGIKRTLYKESGVREYWIVDLEKERVTVYEYGAEERVTIYTLEDQVSVGIFDGECAIDFGKIKKEMDELLLINNSIPNFSQ